jgi:UDP-glucose 4-epimerase
VTAKKRARRDRALVTGAAGGLGRLVCRRLHRSYDVLAVDKRPFPDRPKDVEHFEVDLRRKSALLMLKKKKPDCIVHLGFQHDPRGGAGSYSANVEGTAQLLRFAEQAKVRKFVFLSSAVLYGPSATSSGFLTEEAPLLAAGSMPSLSDLISLDMMVQSFFWKRPETETVILRPVHIVGPHLQNPATRFLKRKAIPTLMGFDPMVQIIHEQDAVEALSLALQPGVRGVFNVVGGGQAPLSRLVAARGARSVPVPGALLRAAMSRAVALRLTTFPSDEMDLLRYSCLVDGGRARDELGFAPTRTLKQTLADLD